MKVIFTATVFNPDTEETFTGWVDPDWNMFELRSQDTDVRTYEVDNEVEAAELIERHLGAVENSGSSITDFYAQDSTMNLETGENWSYAAHISQ